MSALAVAHERLAMTPGDLLETNASPSAVVMPSAFLAIVIDWGDIEPHPLLDELLLECAECGRDLGDHAADWPHGAGDAVTGCPGFRR